MSKSIIYCTFAVFIILIACVQSSSVVTFSLATYNPNLVSSYMLSTNVELSKDITQIKINNVLHRGITFFVVQIHSFLHNVTLGNAVQFPFHSYVSGTNIGLVQNLASSNNYTFYARNVDLQSNNSVFIAVVPYGTAPIPGGCNMEFETEIAPYQKLSFTDSLIKVDAEAGSMPGYLCERQVVTHDVYKLYLPEADLSSPTYFDYLAQMITVNNITKYGTQVSRVTSGALRKFYSAYKGVGSIYVIIANVKGYQAAYVPIVSYACDVRFSESCVGAATVIPRILCGILVFLGLFICFYGHRFFKTEMFLVGLLCGSYVTFLIVSSISDLSERDALIVSLVFGSVFGGLWFAFWWFCGIPILSTLLSLFVLGFLFASIAFYGGLSDFVIMHNDITFWGFFISILLMVVIILTGFVQTANIIACAIVGSFAIVFPFDNYCGSNLRYIFINTIRRATVPKFGEAFIGPPYQLKDLLLTLLWFYLAASGILYQRYHQKGRPPFPPAPVVQSHLSDERTPLLTPANRIIPIHSSPTNA